MENSLKINTVSWITIFEIHGYLDETNGTEVFEKIYSEIGDFSNETKIIFNFGGLKYINSKSIWYTADIITHVDEADGKVYISNCSDTIRDTLELVGITNMVTIVEDYKEAIEKINK